MGNKTDMLNVTTEWAVLWDNSIAPMLIKNSLRKRILAALVQSDMRLAHPEYYTWGGWTLRKSKWIIASTGE
jgi:hypothetical protein